MGDHLRTHKGMRLGTLDLMRCTEQTAVLMAGAEGRGIPRAQLAKFATLVMAGYLSESDFRVRFPVFDEIYEREETRSSPATDPTVLWHAIESDADQDRETEMSLDFCCAPVDGKHALSAGRTGGTASALCFAARRGVESAFASPRSRGAWKPPQGKPSDADRSPPWLVLCGSSEFVDRCGSFDNLRDFVQSCADRTRGKGVSDLIYELFEHPGAGGASSGGVPISVRGALAVLDEPQEMKGWERACTPACKKRVFVGSSIALALAAQFPHNGFDCSLAITRHIHAIHASVAARALNGGLIAIPLYGVKKRFFVEPGPVWSHREFVMSNDAAIVISGISENVILKPVRIRDDTASVHTLCLSARTRSSRSLDHRLALRGTSATRFISFDPEIAIPAIRQGNSPPTPLWDEARRWRKQYEDLFDMEAK